MGKTKIFHKDKLFDDCEKAWEKYSKNPEYFCFPERITIEITNRCNLKCSMCPRSKVKMEEGDMDIGLFKKIIDETVNHLPVCMVPFFRGESLLHPKFQEMLGYAAGRGLKPIQLASNAFFMNAENSNVILDSKVDFLSFSIDANNRELYEKIRKNSDFEVVFSNILEFLNLKRNRGLNLPQVQVSAVKTKENSLFINDFVKFWSGKVDMVRIYYAHSMEKRIGQLQENTAGENRRPCLKLLTDMVIYWDGEAAICNQDWQRDVFIGNVKAGTIKEIWTGPAYEKIRRAHSKGGLKGILPCEYCSHWQAAYMKKAFIGELYGKN